VFTGSVEEDKRVQTTNQTDEPLEVVASDEEEEVEDEEVVVEGEDNPKSHKTKPDVDKE